MMPRDREMRGRMQTVECRPTKQVKMFRHLLLLTKVPGSNVASGSKLMSGESFTPRWADPLNLQTSLKFVYTLTKTAKSAHCLSHLSSFRTLYLLSFFFFFTVRNISDRIWHLVDRKKIVETISLSEVISSFSFFFFDFFPPEKRAIMAPWFRRYLWLSDLCWVNAGTPN